METISISGGGFFPFFFLPSPSLHIIFQGRKNNHSIIYKTYRSFSIDSSSAQDEIQDEVLGFSFPLTATQMLFRSCLALWEHFH